MAALTLAGSCPTGVNVFLLSTRLGTGEALASNTLVISTAASVFTVALWLTLLQTLGARLARARPPRPVAYGSSPSSAISIAGVSPAARRARIVSDPRDFDSFSPFSSRMSR